MTTTKAPKRVWVHVGHEVDGRWVKGFATQHQAVSSLLQHANVPGGQPGEGSTYTSDIGGSHYIKQLPEGMTTAIYRRLLDAYDAREIGDATAHQRALLTYWSW